MQVLDRAPATSSGATASAGRSGTRSTACPTAARSRSASARRGRERGRPAAGYFTKRTARGLAARRARRRRARGTLPGLVAHRRDVRRRGARSGCATSSTTAPASRRRCATTARPSSAHLLPAFGDDAGRGHHAERDRALARARSTHRRRAPRRQAPDRAARHLRARAEGLRAAAQPGRATSSSRSAARIDMQVFSPEEVRALVRAADSEQDAAIYLTAAFTGLRRGELRRAALARRRLRAPARSACAAATPPAR